MKKYERKNLREGISGIYWYTNKSSRKVYVGQAIDIKKRDEQHVTAGSKNSLIDQAILKEGIDSFEFDWLEMTYATKEELDDNERKMIKQLHSHVSEHGYNQTWGNGEKKSSNKNLNKWVVNNEIHKMIQENYGGYNLYGKRVLLVGNFEPMFTGSLVTLMNVNLTFVPYSEDIDFETKVNEEIEKVKSEKFDLIISNPPYDNVGIEVTKKIQQELNFEEFINLMPMRYYIKNEAGDLFRYVDTSSQIKLKSTAFRGALVTSSIVKIDKTRRLITSEMFELNTFTDPQLDDYFLETFNREINFEIIYKPRIKNLNEYSNKTCFYMGKRDPNNHHLPYKKDGINYKFNVEKSYDRDDLMKLGAPSEQKLGNIGNFYLIKFNTEIECKNFTNFVYSKDGFRFISKVFTALNCDSGIDLKKVLPKVDWTKEWTVEEILKDYGYTDSEIKEVMDDLVNFKGMNE